MRLSNSVAQNYCFSSNDEQLLGIFSSFILLNNFTSFLLLRESLAVDIASEGAWRVSLRVNLKHGAI